MRRNAGPNSLAPQSRTTYLVLCVIAFVAVTGAALVPDLGPPGRYHADKAVHAVAYAILTFLPLRLARAPGHASLIVLAVALLSGATELAQLIVPGRYFSFGDLAANAAGLTIGAGATAHLRGWLTPRLVLK